MSAASFALLLIASSALQAQLTTGTVEGIINDGSGHPLPGVAITATGTPRRLVWSTISDSRGGFELALPGGEYELRTSTATAGARTAIRLQVFPLHVRHVVISLGKHVERRGSSVKGAAASANSWNMWARKWPTLDAFAGSYGFSGILLNQTPAAVVQSLDFTGLENTRIPLVSERAFSWTGTAYDFEGMNATDAYQPGYPVVFPDVQALSSITAESSFESRAPNAFAFETGLFVRASDAGWHGGLESAYTNAGLASDNLPSAANRGTLQQPEQYQWLTRDHVDLGGPLGDRVSLYFSGTGQWASQTVPVAPHGEDQNSRLLFGTLGGRIGITARDQLDVLISGSRIDLSNWSQPAGLEALIGWRMMPTYKSMYGFSGLAEVDHLDFIQAGWTRQLPERWGALEVRYGASIAHLQTGPISAETGAQSRTELLTGVVTGAPPLTNFASRQRQSIQAAFQPADLQLGHETHRLAVGGAWEKANVENRFTVPSDLDLITAAGLPAFVVELNTPSNSRGRIQSLSSYARDHIGISRWLSIDVGVLGDFSRGSLPSQSSPAGAFAPAREFSSSGNIISWNTASPHVALTISPPKFSRLVIRGAYSRSYAPLAGRYLDFANPNSLGGLVFKWNDINGDRIFQPGELGQLLRRFGGTYSSVSPSLHRPYADQFDVGANIAISSRLSARVQLFRRDEKKRIGVINVGVPSQAYQPVRILDPGPDGIPGTFDDRQLIVYQQNPATFGTDKFVLTNPSGLRMLYEGFVAEVSWRQKYLDFHASFTTEKSFGPTNPGNGPLENDAGVVGSLYQDPNTLINATGHDFFDRAFVGKIETISRLPSKLGGFELSNVAVYLDGLAFARQLLVTNLAQGPFVVASTIRGSPEGGNRAEYVLNWNLRLARSFQMERGQLRLSADVLNVTNFASRIQESDITGVNFNKRLPVALQPPRFVRFAVGYTF